MVRELVTKHTTAIVIDKAQGLLDAQTHSAIVLMKVFENDVGQASVTTSCPMVPLVFAVAPTTRPVPIKSGSMAGSGFLSLFLGFLEQREKAHTSSKLNAA